jgi:hypothetical protein
LPHGQADQGSMLDIQSRPEPHGFSPRASVFDIVPWMEPGASLQFIASGGTDLAVAISVVWWVILLVPLFVSCDDMLKFVVCIRWL